MKLFVDVGNSRLKWAMGERPGHWRHEGSCATADTTTALDHQWSGLARPQAVWMSCVAPAQARAAVQQWVTGHWNLAVHELVPAPHCCGIRNGYRDPGSLGSDRWAAMIGAWAEQRGALCVVDCGTAVTVDVVDHDGLFRGGAILAGIGLARSALASGTALADAGTGPGVAATALGRDTAGAVAAGLHYGVAGSIERLVAEYRELVGAPLTLYLTGGDADLVAGLLQLPLVRLPDLVLRGLAVAAGPG